MTESRVDRVPERVPRSVGKDLVRIAAVAAAYFATGKLGLLLAIAPGYATALWPPSGIALAAILLLGNRTWPGILLGSFLVNVATSFDGTSFRAGATSAAVAAAIGVGASLQALVGAFLVRRHVAQPLELLREADIAKFLLLGGPVACVVNATVGTGSLALAGLVDARQVAFTWWTWWVGDSIGVAVVTPLVLVAAGEPRSVWRRRLVPVALPLLLTLGVVTALFVRVSAWEGRRIQDEFDRAASALTSSVRVRVEDTIEVLHSLESFRSASQAIDRPEFRAFAERSLARNPAVQAFSWNPRVPAAARPDFERAASQELGRAFTITELDPRGRQVPAAARAEHVPVLFIEPLERNLEVMGFDVASDPTRREALTLARRTASPVMTSRVSLIQDEPDVAGVLVYHPYYPKLVGGAARPAAGGEPEGYFGGVIRLEPLLGPIVARAKEMDVDLSVSDETAPPESRALHASARSRSATPRRARDELESTSSFTIAGRRWSVTSVAGPAYVAAARTWRPWMVLAGGLCLAGLLGAFLLATTGRAVVIERLGAERAAELFERNAALAREIAEREAAQVALRAKDDQLRQAQKLEVVGRLAGGVAHDFNNLLASILGHCEILLEDAGPDHPFRDSLEVIRKATTGATDVTRQLLAFSRKQVLQPKVLDLNAVVLDVQKLLARVIGEDVTLAMRLAPALRRVKVDPNQLEQVVMNLAINARDAMPNGGTLTIATADVVLDAEWRESHPGALAGPHVLLSMEDTGLGIDAENLQHVFEPFFTTKPVGQGTGLGLASVHGIVTQSRGHVVVQSEPGRGTKFSIYLPAAAEDDADEAQAAIAGAAAAPVAEGPITILLVEDDALVREFITRILERSGCRVLPAGSGELALAVSSGHDGVIDVVLTDVIMPGMNGREVLSAVRAARPAVAGLYMSGYSEDAIARQGALDGDAALLQKPFSAEALFVALREAIDRARRRAT